MVPTDRYNGKETWNGWKILCDAVRCNSSILDQIKIFTLTRVPPQGWIHIESSHFSSVWKFSINNTSYIFKQFLNRNILEYFKASIRGSRAKRAWVNGQILIKEGFYTPFLIAYGERSFFSFPVFTFIVTDFLQDYCGAYTMLKTKFSFPLPMNQIKLKRTLIHLLGKYIGQLHSKGIIHGDLRLDNILINQRETEDTMFYLIDNERNKLFPRDIPERLRLKNLVQINMIVLPQITFTDRLRFFRAYLESNPELETVSRYWIRRVFLKTKKRLQKKIPGCWEKS